MGQQMFEPQEDQGQQKQEDQLNAQHGWWATISSSVQQDAKRDRKTREMPKNEHPSTFEEPFSSVPTGDYQAQDIPGTNGANATHAPYEAGYSAYTGSTNSYQQRQSLSPDGDAMEYGYRPYNAYRPSGSTSGQTRQSWQVPPWARPQQQPRGSGIPLIVKVLGVLLLAAILIKVIIPLIIAAFIVFAIAIVFIGIASLIFFTVVLGILRMMGIPIRPLHWIRQRRHMRRGRRGWYFDI